MFRDLSIESWHILCQSPEDLERPIAHPGRRIRYLHVPDLNQNKLGSINEFHKYSMSVNWILVKNKEPGQSYRVDCCHQHRRAICNGFCVCRFTKPPACMYPVQGVALVDHDV